MQWFTPYTEPVFVLVTFKVNVTEPPKEICWELALMLLHASSCTVFGLTVTPIPGSTIYPGLSENTDE